MSHILAIDQGTTSSRAILYDDQAKELYTAQEEFPQIFPQDGWVEHDPEAIWQSVVRTAKKAMRQAGGDISAIGITNQRETCVVWDKATGQPIYNAIVWQDRRTADRCRALYEAGHEPMLNEKTGLLLDPYFSATKAAWILDTVDGARAKAEAGELAFGTIDTFLIWRLSGGRAHVTDVTNASRTCLFNINTGTWDEALCELFGVPMNMLPTVKDCAADFAICDKSVLGQSIPIGGVAGDQQAASIGQGCFAQGDIKSTYGTGCFVLLNTGSKKLVSKNRLLTTIAYGLDGTLTYALEGSIFIAGAAIQWLRDGLGIIDTAAQSETLAAQSDDTNGVYVVTAFTGLGAPHWDPQARGTITGITRDTSRADIVRATLESICFQTYDLLNAMADDGAKLKALKVDGGLAANSWAMQFLADILNLPVERPKNMEATALGAALLAGHQCGLYPDMSRFVATHQMDRVFTPSMDDEKRQALLAGWHRAVSRTLSGAVT